jgi:hypothetical protein
MKLLLQLYTAAAGAVSSTPLAERCAAAGGVPAELVAAYKAVLTDEKLDGSFKVRVSLCLCDCYVIDFHVVCWWLRSTPGWKSRYGQQLVGMVCFVIFMLSSSR